MKLVVSFVFFWIYFLAFNQIKVSENFKPRATVILSNSLSIQKFDVFSQMNLSFKQNKLTYSVGMGVGLNRTCYQNRFFPELCLGLSYHCFLTRIKPDCPVFFGPEVRITYAMLKINETHQFSSFLLGYYFQTGKRWMFIHRAGLGGLLESFPISSGGKLNGLTVGYHVSIGIGYAWN